MKNAVQFYTILSCLLLSFFSIAVQAQTNSIELKLQYMSSDDNTWGVYARPILDFGEPVNAIMGSGQITLLLRKGDAEKINNITNITGRWAQNAAIEGPVEAPNIDYLSFRLLSGDWNQMESQKEQLIFTFQAEECLDTLGLIEATDPFFSFPNSLSVNVGNNLDLLITSNLERISNISGIYSPAAHSCQDCDEDGIVDALEDTNGDGIYTPGVDASDLCDNENDNELNTPPAQAAERACITINDVSFMDPSACDKADGSVTIDAVHEFGNPLQYSLDGGRVWVNSSTIGNLEAGVIYRLELRDFLGLCFESYGDFELNLPECDPCVINPFSITNYPDQTICTGGSTQLNVSGGTSYSWSPALGLSATNIATPTANPTTTTTYTVIVTNANGCTATDDITINISDNPTANAGADASICAGSSTTLNASGGSTYQWSPTAGLSNPSIANPVANPTTATTYTVTVTNANGCTATDGVVINISDNLTVNAGNDASICAGSSTTLNASGGSTYQWSLASGLSNPSIANPIANPSTTTTYTVTVTDANGCTGEDQVVVSIAAGLTINAGDDMMVCPDETTPLSVSGGSTYLWSPAEGLSSTSIANPTVTISEAATYCVTVTDANGCSGSDCISIQIDTGCEFDEDDEEEGTGNTINNCADGPVVLACQDKIICPTGETQLVVNGGIRWEWTPATGLDDPFSPIPIASPSVTTTYTVTGWDENDCFATEEVLVTVDPNKSCDATPPPCIEGLIPEERMCIGPDENLVDVCLPFSEEDLTKYTISVGGDVPTVLHGCDFEMLIAYPYNILPNQTDNYKIKSWQINDTFYSGLFNSIEELVTWMQGIDPTGNWILAPTMSSIVGGNAANIYHTLILTQQSTTMEIGLSPNMTQTPTGTLVQVDMTGKDSEILTVVEVSTSCVDELLIERCN